MIALPIRLERVPSRLVAISVALRLERVPAMQLALSVAFALALVLATGTASATVTAEVSAPARDADVERESEPTPLPPEYLVEERAGIAFAYHPSVRDTARVMAANVARLRAELTHALGTPVLAHARVRIAVNRVDFERIVPPGAEGVDAWSSPALGVVALSVGVDGLDAANVRLREGLAELALAEAAGHARLPTWLRVGFLRDFGGAGRLAQWRMLTWAALDGRLEPIATTALEPEPVEPGTLREAEAVAFVRAMAAGPRRTAFHAMLGSLRAGARLEEAIANAYGDTLSGLEAEWRGELSGPSARAPFAVAIAVLVGLGLLVLRARRNAARRRSLASLPRRASMYPRVGARRALLRRGALRSDGPPRDELARDEPARDELARDEQARDELEESLRGASDEDGLEGAGDGSDVRGAWQAARGDAAVPKIVHDGRWHTLH